MKNEMEMKKDMVIRLNKTIEGLENQKLNAKNQEEYQFLDKLQKSFQEELDTVTA